MRTITSRAIAVAGLAVSLPLLLLISVAGFAKQGIAGPREAIAVAAPGCVPTHDDEPGPYQPNPPLRSAVGRGHVLSGVVRSSRDCVPLVGAKVEFWPEVGGAHRPGDRAAVLTDSSGRYTFESDPPQHVHMRISAHGYRLIYSNLYHPEPGHTAGRLDIVLQSDPACRFFAETGQSLCGAFLEYWREHGGLAQQGFPISGELREISADDGKEYTAQYFERAVFELHPENRPPNDVLLTRLGALRYAESYPRGAPGQQPSAAANARLFSETGKSVGGRFLDYWQANGGLAQQGLPLSDEFEERSEIDGKTYRVQYFERAVFEYHPEYEAPFDVLLAHLGVMRYRSVFAAAGSVATGPAMAVRRACHSATLLQSGKVLIAGGMEREGLFSAGAQLFDPASNSFSPTGSLNTARACHSATLLPNGKVLIAGGDGNGWLDSAELYDPTTGVFSVTGSMRERRSGNTATLLPNGKVLIAGGYGGSVHASAELYDPATGVFSSAGSMAVARNAHSATLLANGKVLLAGGGWRGSVHASAELYDPASGTFSATGSMARMRYKHAAMLLPDGDVLLVGGSDNRDWRGRYTAAELYNAATGTFSPAGMMAEGRFKLSEALALLPDGRLLVAGGAPLVEVYDPLTQTFAPAEGEIDAPRFTNTATALPDGRVLIAGGYDLGIQVTDGTWIYSP